MRGVLVFVVLMSSVASADEAAVRPARFHPSRCEVSGTKFVTPRQLEQELSWNAGLIKLCHELDDPAQLATELKSLLEKAYHAKGFGEVAITVTPKPDDRLRIEISEGARFKRGPIEFVGAKQVDTKRLALWMGQIVPKEPQPIVLAVNEAKQPTLQRLPNGHLRRESPTDVASQLADPDKLAQELEKLPFVPSGAVATSEQKVAPSKLALIAAGKLEPSVFSVLPLPQVLPKQASIQTALKLEIGRASCRERV